MTFSVTDTAPADIDAATHTRPLHDAHAFPGAAPARRPADVTRAGGRRCAAASTRRQRRQSRSAARPATGIPVVELRSEEHTSELQSRMRSTYAVFSLTKKKDDYSTNYNTETHTVTTDNNTHNIILP